MPDPTAHETTVPDAMPRRLGLASASALVVGQVIGVGIFLTPSDMARSLGSPFWLLVAWGSMGVMAICGALSFGALAARCPEDGGGYVYLRRAYGPRVAFLYGWMSLLVTDPGLTAMLAAGLARYAGSLVPLDTIGLRAVAVGVILLMAAVNVAGLAIGSGVLRVLSGLKLGLLALIIVWGFGSGRGSWTHFDPFVNRPEAADPLMPALIGGLLAAFFSLAGFWDVGKVAGEVRDPARNVPRAMTLGVSIVTLVYVLISAVFWYLVPWSEVDPKRGFAAQAGAILFGTAVERVFAGIVIVSVLGSLAAYLMAAPRVYYAMARDGLFPAGLAAISPRLGTPARATAIQAMLASILAASGSFEQILAYFMAVTVGFLALIAATVYVLPVKGDAGRVPGYPITPLGFIVPTALVVLLQAMNDPLRSGGGLAIVALGLPAYRIAFRRGAPRAPVLGPSPEGTESQAPPGAA